MSMLRRISNLFSRPKLGREIDAELRSHIEMRMEDNIAAGIDDALAKVRTRSGQVQTTP